MKVLLTGLSSFTGAWFARTLAEGGHDVIGTLTRPSLDHYEPSRRARIGWTLGAPGIRPIFDVRFGSDVFREMLASERCEVLCHHGADVCNYKSPTFDWRAALMTNSYGLESTLADFRAAGGRAVVLTGSYFEPDEGKGDEPREAFSPYALSKALTWQAFRVVCKTAGLSLGKYVLPNPVGPWEEPRLVAQLVNTWRKGEVAKLLTPYYIRDNIPITLLARDYAAFIVTVTQSKRFWMRRNPSGWVEAVYNFAHRIARELAPRLGLRGEIEDSVQQIFGEPKVRYNINSLLNNWKKTEESAFYDAWAAHIRAAHI